MVIFCARASRRCTESIRNFIVSRAFLKGNWGAKTPEHDPNALVKRKEKEKDRAGKKKS